MAEVKRWSVTYTKHLKQKRKVYHDGFLVLHSSTGKVKLYDESDTLLECKILKDGEVVRSGEMLTFNAYLVDIGDLDGGGQNVNDSKSSPLHRKKFTNPSVSTDQKFKVEKSKVRSLSPSHKIIREFKKKEQHKYGTLQSSPDSLKGGTGRTAASEWHVLYTTQLIQKAKKFHDGFLRSPESGSLNRQVILYDENWNLLESRFLKKGEEVRSGQTMDFHGHLVEIGELKENKKTLIDLTARENKYSSFRKLEMPKQHNNTSVGKSVEKEWQVLYTTQLTQKAKKYHDGFLSLEICGSLGRQAMLYDTSRKRIDSRFLKKDETIQSGDSIAFDAHLVDIGELEVKEEPLVDLDNIGSSYGVVPEGGTRHVKCEAPEVVQLMERVKLRTVQTVGGSSCSEKLESVTSVPKDKPLPNVKSPVKMRTVQTVGGSSCSEKLESVTSVPKDKPLRNAFGILSILQRPVTKQSNASNHGGKSLEPLASAAREIQESDALNNVDSPDNSQLQSIFKTESGSGANSFGRADTEELDSSIPEAQNRSVKTASSTGSSPHKIEDDSSTHAKPFDSAKHTSTAIYSEEGPTFDLGF